jgi:3-deoxy-D-manno-octulosonic-acid transferase
MFNFEAAKDLLLARGAAKQVDNALALAPAVTALFADPAPREKMGQAGREAVAANRGALSRLLALLEPAAASGG